MFLVSFDLKPILYGLARQNINYDDSINQQQGSFLSQITTGKFKQTLYISCECKQKNIQINLMGQLSALFYKNWLLYKRGWLGNCFEFAIPIFFIFFIVIVARLDAPTSYAQQAFINNPQYYKQISSQSSVLAALKFCPGKIVGLAPTGDTLVNRLSALLTAISYTPQTFTTQSDLQTYIRSVGYSTSTNVCFGITVQSSLSNNYQYSLRFNQTNNPDNSDGPNPNIKLTQDQGIDLDLYNRTLTQGMIGANTLVTTAILQLKTNNNNYFQNNVSPMYQETYTLNNIYTNLGQTIGFIVLLPLLILYLRQTSAMLTEKETKVRESMYIMGMRGFNYYFSWFFRYFMVFFVLHFICSVIIASQLSISFYIPFIVFLLFDIVIIIQNFFIQVFLSRAKIGVVISLLFFLVQYILSFIATSSNNPTIGVNTAISVVPHAAFVLAFQTMVYASSYQINPTFSSNLNNYVIGYAIASFIINIAVYIILVWYLDQVIPNEWGAKKHPLFCCLTKQPPMTREEKNIHKRVLLTSAGYQSSHQEVQQGLLAQQQHNQAIEIVGLKKQFGGSNNETIVAVDDLTVSMYKGQIFALLGHNGAGKTTTISMLTGMTDPTNGYISVLGQTEVQTIRQSLGVCPQHDTLYEDLTVEEHLQLFGAFKGLEGQQLTMQVNKLIADVNLQEKRSEYAKNLSGGQKRRLSVALAFAGRSKVIILDQPTSGMDTSARRYIWQLLKAYKNDRIIILTTHFMDEADYLGDRIGIMGGGKLMCCGSSPFLKNRFGVGYSITFTKQSNAVDSAPIINLIKKYSPGSQVMTNVATDLAIQLPLVDLPKFPSLFAQIDQKKASLKFLEYGISITTLQEVFLNVANQMDEQKHKMKSKQNPSRGPSQQQMVSPNHSHIKQMNKQKPFQAIDPETETEFDFDHIPRQESTCLRFGIHFQATFLKRLRVIRRDLKSFFFQLVLPFIIIILGLFLLRISFITDFGSQTITVGGYLSDQNPVVIPIGADVAGTATLMQTKLTTKYSSLVSVPTDTTNTAATTFDQNYLFPIKLSQSTLKAGIFFFTSTTTSGANTIYPFHTLVQTRSPTSPLFASSLAAETILNQLGHAVTIQMSNHPLPRTYQQLQINNTISGFLAGFIFSIALAFKFASIIAFIVKEREDRSKHQQIVSGMSITAYWVANFVYDYALYIFVAFITIGIAKALTISSLTEGNAFAGTWMLFIFYGLCYIPFTYIAAFYYKDYGNAQAAYYFLTFVAGGLLPILTFLLRFISASANPIGRGIAWAFRLFPPFAFGQGLLNMGSVTSYGTYQNNGVALDPLALQISLAPIIYMAVQSVGFFALLLLIQKLQNTQSFMRSFSQSQAEITETKAIEEQDVQHQRQVALAANPSDYQILTKQLRKVYIIDGPKKHKIAVDNLSFGVKRGEVFGLLGINGAGKTTTFKMLAGEVTSTNGQSFFNGLKISQNLDKVRQGLGYCPQFDALIENLTVQQQLELFYDLKSLPSEHKAISIQRKLQELDLTQYADRLSGTLSGGNKRKLSVAMAMIGNPRIIFLDQPSTGMDPKARRFMWKVIARVATQKQDATVVLTTHSMEEAEALSSRLGIMVSGNFQCIGTPQHIKSKYGDGLEVQIKLKTPQRRDLLQKMKQKNVVPTVVKQNRLQAFFDLYQVEAEDRLQISEKGLGNYIYYTLKDRKQVEVYTLVQFAEICRQHRLLINQVRIQAGDGDVQQLEKLQTFVRLKIKGKPNIGKLFEFLEKQKGRLNIQQYTIKQATVEQIFNKFAENGEQTQYGP